MKKEKTLEAILVIVVGFTLLYFIYDLDLLLYIAFGVGILGVLIKPLATFIAIAWYKLGDLLGYIVSKVVLGVMFYFLLVPIALLHNLFNNDKLNLKNKEKSVWTVRNQTYSAKDLKNIW